MYGLGFTQILKGLFSKIPDNNLDILENIEDRPCNEVSDVFEYNLELKESKKYEEILRLEEKREAKFSYNSKEKIFKEKIGKSFADMYQKHFSKLVDYINRLVDNREVAHDLASESIIKSLEAIDTFDVSKKFQYVTWLYSIAKNHTYGYFKRKDSTNITMDAPIDESGGTLKDYLSEEKDDTDSSVDIASLKVNIIRKYIEQLDDKYKQAIIMRDFQNMTYDAISTALDININTTKSRIHCARIKIQELVAEEFKVLEDNYYENL
jgi:RNA polymerase sigma-70 factor (ECF subfamily)